MSCHEAAGTGVFQVALGVVLIGALLAMLSVLVVAVFGLWRELMR